ncbi:hypothetical protein B0H17DRAFT_1146746 [Mycena rosella]|uniref:Uncharacterized protein n=1 Tax=Mycena rosella TaxID=1033263 RepID=A0AAD7G383_MYCRO|nr:hypothetical protein B0H17DRAFT_1146746 [Mycena rosella]
MAKGKPVTEDLRWAIVRMYSVTSDPSAVQTPTVAHSRLPPPPTGEAASNCASKATTDLSKSSESMDGHPKLSSSNLMEGIDLAFYHFLEGAESYRRTRIHIFHRSYLKPDSVQSDSTRIILHLSWAGGDSGRCPPFTVFWYPFFKSLPTQWNIHMKPKLLNPLKDPGVFLHPTVHRTRTIRSKPDIEQPQKEESAVGPDTMPEPGRSYAVDENLVEHVQELPINPANGSLCIANWNNRQHLVRAISDLGTLG